VFARVKYLSFLQRFQGAASGIRSRAVRSRSAIGFAAVFDGSDAKGVFVFMEAHAVVADAEAELGRLDVLKMLDVALASVQIASERMEDAESSGCQCLAIRLVGIERSATHALKIFESEAELGQNFFVRNTLATVEGGAGSGDLASFFLRDWLIVQGGIGETASHRISHHFEQMNDGKNLAGSQTLDQIVGLLFFVGGGHQE
jgi:hypothetical protein